MMLKRSHYPLAASVAASLLFLAAPAFAISPVAFPSQTAIVTLNGAPVQGSQLRSSIVFDDVNQMYHLWALDSTLLMGGITHATSPDGVTFTSTGTLTVPASWWTTNPAYGATAEPSVEFIRADKVGTEWFLTLWSPHDLGGTYGLYDYNSNIWKLGTNPDGSPNNTLTQQGPLNSAVDSPVGPGGTHLGSFGIANNNIFLKTDIGNFSLTGFTYTNPTVTARPVLTPAGGLGIGNPDLFASTPYAVATHYIHNAGRVQTQTGAIGAYYSFRDLSGAKMDKNIWYVESADGGATWSAPVDAYAGGGAAMLVSGAPNAELFSHPEVTTNQRLFFSSGAGTTCIDAASGAVLLTAPSPRISAAFSPAAINVGSTSTLTITLTTPDIATGATACGITAPATLFTAAGFSGPLTLPAGLALATVPTLTGAGCTGGTVSGTVGGNTFSVSGYTIAPASTCTLTFDVTGTAPRSGTATVVPRTIGTASVFINDLNIPASHDAAASLTVTALQATTTSIPTLSSGSLVGLIGLTGLFAFFGRRLRRLS